MNTASIIAILIAVVVAAIVVFAYFKNKPLSLSIFTSTSTKEGLTQYTMQPGSGGNGANNLQGLPHLPDDTSVLLPKRARVALAAIMRNPTDLPLWLKYHRRLGIMRFYIRLEDSVGWQDYLEERDDVVLEIGESDKTSGNNYTTIMARQVKFVNESIDSAIKSGDIDWIVHIDADELLHGERVLSVLDDLQDKPEIISVKMSNAEAIFDENKNDTCFSAQTFLRCDKGAPCRAYVNGKSICRVVHGVRLSGPHDFAAPTLSPEKAVVHPVEFDDLHVLHFEGCSFGAWAEKYYHMSKKNNDDMPFDFYKKSIGVAKQAFNAYKEKTMADPKGFDSQHIYSIHSAQ